MEERRLLLAVALSLLILTAYSLLFPADSRPPAQSTTPATLHSGPASNVCAIVIRPQIAGLPLPATAQITNYQLSVNPTVSPRQSAALILDDATTSQQIAALPRTVDTAVLEFDISGVAAGTYIVRVQVDGAESLLDHIDTDADQIPDTYAGPTLVVTP